MITFGRHLLTNHLRNGGNLNLRKLSQYISGQDTIKRTVFKYCCVVQFLKRYQRIEQNLQQQNAACTTGHCTQMIRACMKTPNQLDNCVKFKSSIDTV